ncbi:MAG: pentapeptide repeat-containing protein [bacterium]
MKRTVPYLVIVFIGMMIAGSITRADASYLTGVEAARLLESGQSLKNATVNGDIILKGRTFSKPFLIEKSTILGHLVLGGDTVSDKVVFNQKPALVETTIEGRSIFRHAIFSKGAVFQRVAFERNADFRDTRFSGRTEFNISSFSSLTQFNNAEFENVVFRGNRFTDNVMFLDSHFRGRACFFQSEFQGFVLLHRTRFDHVLDLSGATFNQRVVFRGAEFLYIRLKDVSANKDLVELTWKQVKGRVVDEAISTSEDRQLYAGREVPFESIRYTSRWEGVKEQYLFLSSIFKERGQYDDADEAYYAYKITERQLMRSQMERTASWFVDVLCGYGVKPWNTMRFGLFLVFFFALFYYPKNAISSSYPEHRERNTFYQKSSSALYYSVITFTTVGTGDYYPNGIARLVSMVEGFLGYAVMALFLVTLSMQLLR